MPRFPRGITKRPQGWRVSVRVQGTLYQRSFKPSLPLETVERELAILRTERRGKAIAPDTLQAEITRYLTSYFAGRSGYDERKRHLELWRDALGASTLRAAITREDVSRVLHGWLASQLSPETCNKRRAALLAFFNALEGKGGSNPVRDVPKFKVPGALARGLDFARVKRALKAMTKSRSRARLKVMAYCGARPGEVMKIRPEHWDDRRKTLILHGTAKGHGTKPRVIPLTDEAQAALREFEDTDAWGKFSWAPLGRMWKAAAVAAGLPTDTRVYDLRHSFGTEVYRATGDLRVVKELMGHSSIAMTERYTLGAIPERQAHAMAAFGAAVKRAKVATRSWTSRKSGRKRR